MVRVNLLTSPRLSASDARLLAAFVGQNSAFSETGWRAGKTLNQIGLGLIGRGGSADIEVNYQYEQDSKFRAEAWMLSLRRSF